MKNNIDSPSSSTGRLEWFEGRRAQIILPILLSVLLAAISFSLHQVEGTMLQHGEEIWQERIEYASEFYPLSKRHFTTYTMIALHDWFGIPFRTGFVLLQYTLFILLGIVSYRFFRVMRFDVAWSLLGQAIVLGSYPVLCAFFIPVYTWDDFWEYLFSVTAFLLLFERRMIVGAVVLGIATLARESTFILWPVWVFGIARMNYENRSKKIAAIVLPAVILAVYTALNFEPPNEDRWHVFSKNFSDAQAAENTAFSLIVSFGFLWLTSYLAMATRAVRLSQSPIKRIAWFGAMFTVPVYTILSLLFGLARETRLFYPPFLFVIPLSLWYLQAKFDELYKYYTQFHGLIGLATIAGAFPVGYLLAQALFPGFDFRGWTGFSQAYLGFHFGVILILVVPQMVNSIQRVAYQIHSSHTEL